MIQKAYDKEHIFIANDFAVPLTMILGSDPELLLTKTSDPEQLRMWIYAHTGKVDLTCTEEEKQRWVAEWNQEKERREGEKKEDLEREKQARPSWEDPREERKTRVIEEGYKFNFD